MNALIQVDSLREAEAFGGYHPHYLDAVLTSDAATAKNPGISQDQWKIPAIVFSTEDWTRRSMALNGMRMSTEYFASGSERIFTLIAQRLAAGQSDVVHDVLVYLWERVLQARADAQEAKTLQAESLAAFLGLDVQRTTELFSAAELSATALTQQVENGFAGVPRRTLEILPVTENLLARLQPELDELRQRENQVFRLINEITVQLYENK